MSRIEFERFELPKGERTLNEGACVSVIRGAEETAVLAALELTSEKLFGELTPEQAAEQSMLQASSYLSMKVPVQIWCEGDSLVVLEVNGFWGADARNLIGIANGQLAASAYWNVNAAMQFTVVEGGVRTREFDPLFRHERAGRGNPGQIGFGQPYSVEDELPFGSKPRASALALLSDTTGVDTSWGALSTPHRTWMRDGW